MTELEFNKGIAKIFNDHFKNNINDDIKEFATNYVDEFFKENGSRDVINIWSDSLEGTIEVELEKTAEKVKAHWDEYIKDKDPKDIPVRLDGDLSIAFHGTGCEVYIIDVSLDMLYLQSIGDVQISVDGCENPRRIIFKTKYDEPEFYIYIDDYKVDIYAYAEERIEDEGSLEITWGDDE